MDGQPQLLLCIEDDEDDIALIEEVTSEIGPSIVFVPKENGKEALMFLNRQKEQNYLPCLILLDINMPVMNGKEMLDALKKDAVFKNIPLIVFTTSSGQRERLLCEAYGVEMITKPNRFSEFKEVVSRLVLSRCS